VSHGVEGKALRRRRWHQPLRAGVNPVPPALGTFTTSVGSALRGRWYTLASIAAADTPSRRECDRRSVLPACPPATIDGCVNPATAVSDANHFGTSAVIDPLIPSIAGAAARISSSGGGGGVSYDPWWWSYSTSHGYGQCWLLSVPAYQAMLSERLDVALAYC
jgi:hypothetical protein